METRKLKKGNKYREKVYFNGKVINSPYFLKKTDASRWKRLKLSEIDKMKSLGTEYQEDISLSEFSKIFLSDKSTLTKKTQEFYKNILDQHILPEYGKKLLRQITLKDANLLKKKIHEKGLSATRNNNILNVFKIVLNHAVTNDYLPKSPLRKLEKIKEQQRTLTYWLPEEIQDFLGSQKDSHYYPLYVLALNTGMRLGELCGLCWDAIDFTNQQIIVKRSFDRYGLKNSTKSNKSRCIPMNHIALKTLKSLDKKKGLSDYVFRQPNGSCLNYEHFTARVFNKAVKESGVKKIRFHDLRTTFASNYCMNGGDIFALSKILGHHSVEITEKKYAHLHPSFLKDQISCIGLEYKSNSPDLDPQKNKAS